MSTIQSLKVQFISVLVDLQPEEEILSFFNILVNERLGLTRVDMALNPLFELNTADLNYFLKALEQLKKNVPIQYVIGKTQFYGIPILVSEKVLIPRPETEELVDWILEDLKNKTDQKLLDIGTGSGCIPIAILKNTSNVEFHATDISNDALEIATKNATMNEAQVHFFQSDILKTKGLAASYDLIVSNPPYVLQSEKAAMKENVLKYEPHRALFVPNSDPLVFYRKIGEIASKNLTNGGRLYFEINQKYGAAVMELLQSLDFKNCVLRKDIYGADRMIKAQR